MEEEVPLLAKVFQAALLLLSVSRNASGPSGRAKESAP